MGCYSSKVDTYVLRLEELDKGVALSSKSNSSSHRASDLTNISVENNNNQDSSSPNKKKNLKSATKAVIAINRMSSGTFIKGKSKMSTRFVIHNIILIPPPFLFDQIKLFLAKFPLAY